MNLTRPIWTLLVTACALLLTAAPSPAEPSAGTPPAPACPPTPAPQQCANTTSQPLPHATPTSTDTTTTTTTVTPPRHTDTNTTTSAATHQTTTTTMMPTPTTAEPEGGHSIAPILTSQTQPTTTVNSGSLTVSTGPLIAATELRPGATLHGTMYVTVTDTRTGNQGWKVEVHMPTFSGTSTSSPLQPTQTTYIADDTDCSHSTGPQHLSAQPRIIQQADTTCTATWNSAIDIAIPPDGILADTYTAVITHSIA